MTYDALTADEWLYETLSAASGLTVYIDGVPDTASYPLIEIRPLTAQTSQTMNATDVMHRPRFVIVVVNQDSKYSALETEAALIYTTLHRNQGGTVGRGDVWFAARTQPFRNSYTSGSGGRQYRELGGIYQVWTEAGQ